MMMIVVIVSDIHYAWTSPRMPMMLLTMLMRKQILPCLYEFLKDYSQQISDIRAAMLAMIIWCSDDEEMMMFGVSVAG